MAPQAREHLHPGANRQPVFMAHGELDPVVPFVAGEHSAEVLRGLGFPLDWRAYEMGHAVCAAEIRDLGDWLDQRLASGWRMRHDARTRDEPWLPDFCRLPRLVRMFGVAELAVLVVAFAPDGGAEWNTGGFVSASGFALWLAMTISVLLCAARVPLSRLPVALGSIVAVAAASLVALAGAAMLFQVD